MRKTFPFRVLACSMMAILFVCLWPVQAFAANLNVSNLPKGLPDDFYNYYVSGGYSTDAATKFTDSGRTAFESALNPDYVAKAATKNVPAPKGTDITQSIKKGYTTFWVDGSEHQVSTFQRDLMQSTKGREAVSTGRYTSTSSMLQKQIKTAKATGKTKTAILNSSKTNITDILSRAMKSNKADKSSIKALTKLLGKGATRLLGGVGSYMLSMDVTNGILDWLNVDRLEECNFVTNDIARLAIGLNSYCSVFENLPEGMPSEFDLSDFPCGYANHPKGNPYVYTICFTKMKALSEGDPDSGTWPGWYVYGNIYMHDFTKVSGGLFSLFGIHTAYKDAGFSGDVSMYFDFYYKSDGSYSLKMDSTGFQKGSTMPFVGELKGLYSSQCPASGVEFEDKAGNCLDSLLADWLFYTANGDRLTFVDGLTSTTPTDRKPDSQDLQKQKAPEAATTTVTGSDGQTYTATGSMQNGTLPAPTLPEDVTPTTVQVTSQSGTQVVPKTELPTQSTGTLDLIDVATGKSCYDEAYGCATWAQQVEQATGSKVTLSNMNTTTTAAKQPFKCMWNGSDGSSKEIGIGECTVLSNQWTKTNVSNGTTASDPNSGEQITDPSDSPKKSDKPSYGQCVAEDVSWNPVSWVFVPVKCALTWAFEPSQDNVTTQTVLIRQQANSSFVGDMQSRFNNMLPQSTGDACQGPEFNLSFLGYDIFKGEHPMSVCEGTGLSFLPSLVKSAITVLVGIGAFFIVRRHVSNLIGLNDDSGKDGVA